MNRKIDFINHGIQYGRQSMGRKHTWIKGPVSAYRRYGNSSYRELPVYGAGNGISVKTEPFPLTP